MKIVKLEDLDEGFFLYHETEEIDSVRQIVADVKNHGDQAVRKYTAKFDGVELDHFAVSEVEIKNAHQQLENDFISAIELAAENIRRFAIKQKAQLKEIEYEIRKGVFSGQKVIAIERVGVYAPGGRYPLPSTVLMCAIPARVSGVDQIILCSPPSYNGSIHPAILMAANICQIDMVYRIGGVQAIAAMAYGTETIKPVDKIVGPGNQFITAAKKLVYGTVGIDFIAGPTELLIIADDSACPAFIATDLLAQAEHDTQAMPILITTSQILAAQVKNEIEQQVSKLTTADIARQSLDDNGLIILVNKIEDAIPIANKKAPEHLELHVENAQAYVDRFKNYGTLFIGPFSAAALGDYSSGLNHTLPTNTCARYTGGLSVKDFLKTPTTLRVTEEGISIIGPSAIRFGKIEGLEGHARSIEIRMKSR